MSMIFDQEALDDRARDLAKKGCNGIARVFVTLDAATPPQFALLDVEFYNAVGLAAVPPLAQFSLSGGVRLKGAADGGPVAITAINAGANSHTVQLRIAPIGDYANYTLSTGMVIVDPLSARIDFKFRPGCFNMNCAPVRSAVAKSRAPLIDYLARDYPSFRHVLINAMAQRVPDWQPTSEADLDQVLIDLIAAEGDLLADFHDRTMNERYWALARKRVSLARSARMMDYHIHEGNQAATWLALMVSDDIGLPEQFGVWASPAGTNYTHQEAVVFTSEHEQKVYQAINTLHLYTWGNTVGALEAGTTQADLTNGKLLTLSKAQELADYFTQPGVDQILLQQERNPETGRVNGRDPTQRQVLRLLPPGGPIPRVEVLADPVVLHDPAINPLPALDPIGYFVRLRWINEDRLQRRYCFVTNCDGTLIGDLALFYGNLLWLTQGRPWKTTFRAPDADLADADFEPFEGHDESYYEPTKWGALCLLTHGPLAYRDTPPGGQTPTRTSLTINVSNFTSAWQEQSDLIESDALAQHFIVETDEQTHSRVRFGNGVNGRELPDASVVTAHYRVGQGIEGNVGSDSLIWYDTKNYPLITRIWNPLDVSNGREAESPQVLQRRVPEAYRRVQRRAVTLDDYAHIAEQNSGVSHAKARYVWSGSFRSVRLAVDPAGSNSLSPLLLQQLNGAFNAQHLIGEDVEIRLASYAALDILLTVCIQGDYWQEDIAALLEDEFSASYTQDGRVGFFHPDNWTFGQALYASQMMGRALQIQGVGRVLEVSIRRWHSGAQFFGPITLIAPEDLPHPQVNLFQVDPFEIIRVDNDPSRLEFGRIRFEITGGRR